MTASTRLALRRLFFVFSVIYVPLFTILGALKFCITVNNIIAIILYLIILFLWYRNLFTVHNHFLSMYIVPIVTIGMTISIFFDILYVIAYLYLLNFRWPTQQRSYLASSQILFVFEPRLRLPGRPPKFWNRIYITKKGKSYMCYEFSMAKLKDSFNLITMCCPTNITPTVYEKWIKVQKVEATVSNHDGNNLLFYVREEDSTDILDTINISITDACKASDTKRVVPSK